MQDNDAYRDIETDATRGASRRMMARASKATIMLAVLAIWFGFRYRYMHVCVLCVCVLCVCVCARAWVFVCVCLCVY